MDFYFSKYENRTPPKPVPHSHFRELTYQYLSIPTEN